MQAFIFNIQRFSIHDGPGIRTTIFFQGCPLQCAWCHNPEGIPHHLQSTNGLDSKVKRYSIDELMDEILKDKVFFEESGGGVTFSGGEPLMQTAFLVEILKRLKDKGIHTAVDTSGYAPLSIFREVVGLADLILFDIKIADNAKHKIYTGTDNTKIHRNLQYLLENDIAFRIRIPLVNEITAGDANLTKIASLLNGNKNVDIDLLSYHDLGKGKRDRLGIRPDKTRLTAPTPERMQEINHMFHSHGFRVNTGG